MSEPRPVLVPLDAPPVVKPCTIDTTPEEWADAHRTIMRGTCAPVVVEWGAVCEGCGAVWSRDPAMGGPDRRRPA